MKLKRFVAACGVAALLNVGCSSTTASDDVSVETFNLGLAGAYVPNEVVRKPAVIKALSEHTSDIICVQEAWYQADKDAIIAAAVKGAYPYYAAELQTDDSEVNDPTDANGVVPPVPTSAPCADNKDELNAALDCARASDCTTEKGNDDATVTSTSCLRKPCIEKVGPLLLNAPRCYGCLAPLLAGTPLSRIRKVCTENLEGGLAFDGQDGLMILSDFPLSNIKSYVLPSTWNRRTILHADVALPNGATLGVYCNHLSPIFADMTLPYTGQYGAGKVGEEGWANEQALQANKLVAFVKTTSGSGKAVVLGDFNASRQDVAARINVEGGSGLATLDVLEKAFTPAVAASYKPACTFCSTNPNLTQEDREGGSQWIDHIFLYGISPDAVKSTTVTRTAATVDGIDIVSKQPTKVPPSDHYGLRSVIAISK